MCMHAKNELSCHVFLFVSGTLHVYKHLSVNVVKAGPTFYLGSCRILFSLAVVIKIVHASILVQVLV